METTRNLQCSSTNNKKLECCIVYERKKKKKISADRISNLPDSLLHHILSFLETRHAVQTCLLSKRWRVVWTCLPFLNFNFTPMGKNRKEPNDYMGLVDQVLLHRDSSTSIQRFRFVCDDWRTVATRVSTWILSTVNRNVQELLLEISIDEDFLYPQCLFISKSLKVLKLSTGGTNPSRITLPDSICLPQLTTLHLDSLSFEDQNLTNKLFSSCPVLESLFIRNCRFHGINLEISSLKLKHLRIDNFYWDYSPGSVDINVKLDAPNLISIIFNDYMSSDYTVESLSSLIQADIDMKVEERVEGSYSVLPKEKKLLYAQRMMKTLKALHNVTDLTLSAWFLEVVSGALHLSYRPATQFFNLRRLNLRSWLSVDCIHSIVYLLQISPIIEYLSLEIDKEKCFYPPSSPYWEESYPANEEDFWEPGSSMQSMLYSLKCVEIRGVMGCINELKFLEFVLKNAMVLEKLAIVYISMRSSHRHVKDSWKAKFTKKFKETLTSTLFPNGLKHCFEAILLVKRRTAHLIFSSFIILEIEKALQA